jgi:hypothetical protein
MDTEIRIVIRNQLRRTRDAIVHPRTKRTRVKQRGRAARYGKLVLGGLKAVGQILKYIVGALAFLSDHGN